MGLCVECGCFKSNPYYKTCEKCRDRDREKKAKKLFELFAVSAKHEITEVKKDHKCWSCEWSNFLGDRFFCPFVEGTCAKEDKK